MALNPCVKIILCALGQATLNALDALLTAQIAIIDAKIAELTAQLAILSIATIPLQIARGVAQTALNAARQSISLVPLNIIAGCADLGDFNTQLVRVIDDANADFNDIINDLNRKLSLQDEVEALIQEFGEIRLLFRDIQLTIAECA